MMLKTKYRLRLFFSAWLFCFPFVTIGVVWSTINNGFSVIGAMSAYIIIVCGFGSLIGFLVAFSDSGSNESERTFNKSFIEWCKSTM